MKTHFKKVLFAGIFAAFFSCDTEENLPVVDEQNLPSESNSIDPRFIRYLEAIGFNEISLSEIHETEDGYVVEGDISFSKAELITAYNEMEELQGQNLQWRYSTMVTTPANQITTFKYKFDSNIPSGLRNSIRDGFVKWNQIRNYKIRYEEVTSGTYNTLITSTNSDPNSYAYAYLPIPTSGGNGTVGNQMVITLSLFGDLDYDQRVFVTAHEIGHLVGLRHTDSSASPNHILVPGTYTGDPHSIMNSGGFFGLPVPSWTGFPYLDQLSIRTLYPLDTSEKPFYTYLKSATGGYNWTPDWSTYGYGAQGFAYWGYIGYVYTSPKSGTVPLYKYRHNITHVDYLSLNPNLGALYPGNVNQGEIARVYTTGNSERTPVYEWYHPNKGFHFTTLTNDGVVSSGGWTGGAIAFYTIKVDQFN
ncbi:M57 family metalloprotease [Algoriphagus sp. Y33]|uniref:M57 family metalloprotease n=1 Tax=Algoriphagus sp. Y33 TaxID=2772483 RepID=UPI00177C2F0A|nr:M57 family metalloprotease [Algoriphagus sp. Y33]